MHWNVVSTSSPDVGHNLLAANSLSKAVCCSYMDAGVEPSCLVLSQKQICVFVVHFRTQSPLSSLFVCLKKQTKKQVKASIKRKCNQTCTNVWAKNSHLKSWFPACLLMCLSCRGSAVFVVVAPRPPCGQDINVKRWLTAREETEGWASSLTNPRNKCAAKRKIGTFYRKAHRMISIWS